MVVELRVRSLSTTEVAVLIRRYLKREFPATRFYVRSSFFSGGSSIHVDWVDGPAERTVEDALGPYRGTGFDGSIDLRYYLEHWLLPDGSVTIAHTDGTVGSHGSVPEIIGDPPHPEAQLVRLGNTFLSCHRSTLAEARRWFTPHRGPYRETAGRTPS